MKKILAFMFFLLLVGFSSQPAFAMSDVKKSDYYYDAVQWGQQQKIISGFENNTFRPNEQVTHRQFIKMYTNTFDFDKTDLQKGNYYAVIDDYGIEFDYASNSSITRGEVAVLLAYANGEIQKPDTFDRYDIDFFVEPAAQFLLEKGISGGQQRGDSATKKIGADNYLTRAQAITFLYRLQQKQLHTLATSVKLYKEPAKFTEQDAVIRSYDFGDDIHYHVLAEGQAFRLAVTYKDYVIGGYETEEAKELFGAVIGKPISDQQRDTKEATYHLDSQEGNKVRAISWWAKAISFKEIVQKARQLTYSTETTNISKLYGELASEFRVKYGLNPLQEHAVLSTAALGHSKDMAQRNYFSHSTPEGLSPSDRVQQVPGNAEINSAGENISAGYYDIFAAHTGWINSSGHRANLLKDSYYFIGFGLADASAAKYSMYYTTKFARN